MFIDNALAIWIVPTGVIPGMLLFELVSIGTAWLMLVGLLASVCGILWAASTPFDLPRAYRRWRRRLHVAPVRTKRHPQPQRA